tara:strand:- start:5 stop:1324 length:1320 start_codon:yes stop_codon:yes gene_type:complete
MPTTKTISQIGATKFELIKDANDAFKFTVASAANEQDAAASKPVMYISSARLHDATPIESASGLVTVSNIKTIGDMSSTTAEVGGIIGIGNKILFRDPDPDDPLDIQTLAAIYSKAGTNSSNHTLILDPYQADHGLGDPATHNGTVVIRGNLIVEGDKTFLDTAEHITSDNIIGINASLDSNGVLTHGPAITEGGIKVYCATGPAPEFVYNFVQDKPRWIAYGGGTTIGDFQANDIDAKDIVATGAISCASLSTPAATITGGTINNTMIGNSTPSSGVFTSLEADSISVTGTFNINNNIISTKGVQADTIGNIVKSSPLASGPTVEDPRKNVVDVTASFAAPLHDDIAEHFGQDFAAGKCIVTLISTLDVSVGIFNFSTWKGAVIMTLDQEYASAENELYIDYDVTGVVNLFLGTNTASAHYFVKVLPITTSVSINEAY